MRIQLASILLLIGSFSSAQTAPASSQSMASSINQGDNAKKARALLDQMIQALGGQAYLNVKDISQEGRTYSYYNGQPNSVGTPFWRFVKPPDKERTEFTKQRDIAFVNTGDKGYEISYKGTAAQEPDQLRDYLRRRNHSLDYVIRVWLPDPKTALFYDGPKVAQQKPCDSVTLMNAENDSVTIFIDSNRHLPVQRTFEWRDPMDKLKNSEDEIYDNYRDVQGVMTPHILLRTKNGDTVNQRFLTSVKYNSGLSDSLFQATVTYDPYKRSGPRQ